jgi:predicted aconitase with swiveling domain
VVSATTYRVLHKGAGNGRLMVLNGPLSLWGGLDPETGRIIDKSHPEAGQTVTGVVLFMTHGRGSSSSSSVLAEAIRLGTAPAGLILGEVDSILVTGAYVASLLYGRRFPVLCGPQPVGEWVEIEENGDVTVR